jgi:hypothetical protein
MSKQRGFSAIIILIVIAVLVGIAAVVIGYFAVKKQNPASAPATSQPTNLTVPLTKKDPSQIEMESKIGTAECPEVDYTGCDTTGNFMTWSGEVAATPEPSYPSTIILK